MNGEVVAYCVGAFMGCIVTIMVFLILMADGVI